MKKILFLMVAFATFAFAGEGETVKAYSALAVGIVLGLAALGGAIGVGLFLGSAGAMQTAGPSLMLTYFFAGIIMFYIMRALGEVAVEHPVSGSFSAHATAFLGPKTGYLTGWTYWFMWVVTCMAEITAVGVYVHYWLPDIPQWIPALLALLCMTLVNLIAVKIYGEFEFWFALIKVVAIVAFIVIGASAIVHIWPFGDVSGMEHLTSQGFMPNGFQSVVVALLGAMFAFIGAEIVTVAAAEAKDPSKEIIRTTRSVVWRISLFYIGSIFIVVCLVPYTDPGLKDSTVGTYAVTMQHLGIPYAKQIVNFVVLTSVCSCFNSALYTSSRMLFSLSRRGDAPRAFQILGKNTKAPYVGVLVSSILALITVVLTATDKMNVFDVLMAATGAIALLVYLCISVSQLNMRRKLEASGTKVQLKMWLFPWLTYAVIFVIVASLITMVVEGTFFNEVVYTSIFGGILVVLGLMAQKYNWGGEQRAQAEKERLEIQAQLQKNKEA